MTAASGTARTGRPGTWDGPDNLIPHHTRLPLPAAHIIGLPAERLKDACGAASGGRAHARSLTRPVVSHGKAAARKAGAPVTHARHRSKTPENPVDTAPPLQG